MFKIGEFSKLTQVSIRMLRYYDENGLLIPAKVNPINGYRMYTGEQIATLKRILFLREIGLNVSEIRRMLEDWSEDGLRQELMNQELECQKNILKEQEKLVRIKTALLDMNKDNLNLNMNITLKTLPSYSVLSYRKTVPDYFAEGDLWKELTKYIGDKQLPISQACESFTIYHDNEYKENAIDMELCIIIDFNMEEDDEISYRITESVEHAACFMIYGPYENISAAYQEFAYWMEQHPEYEMLGESRQICHKGVWNENNPQNYVTELQIPIRINI
jgi:Predicted transcriptional regulators